MQTVLRPRAARSAGALSARILVALASLAGAFTLTVVGAEPAGAYTIERSPDEIVITSRRLSEDQTHVTVIFTMRSNGDYGLLVKAHCTAATRKWIEAFARVQSPANLGRSWGTALVSKRRIEAGEWKEWTVYGGNDPWLVANWSRVLNDPDLAASLSMQVYRTGGPG